jgi:hypothetical protein
VAAVGEVVAEVEAEVEVFSGVFVDMLDATATLCFATAVRVMFPCIPVVITGVCVKERKNVCIERVVQYWRGGRGGWGSGGQGSGGVV